MTREALEVLIELQPQRYPYALDAISFVYLGWYEDFDLFMYTYNSNERPTCIQVPGYLRWCTDGSDMHFEAIRRYQLLTGAVDAIC